MTEKRKRGKPPIYKTPSVRLTVQIEATTMEALEAFREEKGMARSVAVNRLIGDGLRQWRRCKLMNETPFPRCDSTLFSGVEPILQGPKYTQPETDGAKAG